MLNVVGSLQLDVPVANVASLDGAMQAAVPADVTSFQGSIGDQFSSTTPGNAVVTANLSASMGDTDIGKFIDAMVAAVVAAGATVVPGSGSLTF